ncbi:hypothetical protein ACFPL7_22395 [Dongia soli]|uniref:Serine dehydrogenase proteinase n=1 Tax=Dongia soli TaxID=600628 RepID=A0ABU5E7N5_9PROT|nr:hypothetical protein [Dongia soli]MDY0882342.1 hypothetical protein [Dongia soli]
MQMKPVGHRIASEGCFMNNGQAWLGGVGDMAASHVTDVIRKYVKQRESDLFLYSGPIEYTHASEFVDLVCRKSSGNKRVLLFLTTPGGDPHAAYRMIRALRARYSTVRIAVCGPCKSAGTLMTIGAHELLMSETGELGPLDVQLTKPDELMPNSSSLDIFQALAVATSNAFEAFEQCMVDLVGHSSGNISTKTAAEIARDFVVGLYAPITGQIDPVRLGEVRRASKIAHQYAEKLGSHNLKSSAIDTLVNGYPSHGFVIDAEEAKRLFKNVLALDEDEKVIAGGLKSKLRHTSPDVSFTDFADIISQPEKEADNGERPDRAEATPTVSGRNGGSAKNGENPRKQPRKTGSRASTRPGVAKKANGHARA